MARKGQPMPFSSWNAEQVRHHTISSFGASGHLIRHAKRKSQQRRYADSDSAEPMLHPYQFPSAVLMIEGHHNQTVRDFLQICSSIETTEISNTDDVQVMIE